MADVSNDDGQWPTWTAYVGLALLGIGVVVGLVSAATTIRSASDVLAFVGPAAGPVAAVVVAAGIVALVRFRLARRQEAWSRRSRAQLAQVLAALAAERAVPVGQRATGADDGSLERVAAELRSGLGLVDEGAAPLAADRIDVARRAAEARWAPDARLTREVASLRALVDTARRVQRGVEREARRGGGSDGGSPGATSPGGGRSRWRVLAKKTWFKPLLVLGFIALVFAVRFLPSADHGEIVERLEDTYGVPVTWEPNGTYERDTLVVDGEDLSEECHVTGDWGPLDDLAIECDGVVAPVPVED